MKYCLNHGIGQYISHCEMKPCENVQVTVLHIGLLWFLSLIQCELNFECQCSCSKDKRQHLTVRLCSHSTNTSVRRKKKEEFCGFYHLMVLHLCMCRAYKIVGVYLTESEQRSLKFYENIETIASH